MNSAELEACARGIDFAEIDDDYPRGLSQEIQDAINAWHGLSAPHPFEDEDDEDEDENDYVYPDC